MCLLIFGVTTGSRLLISIVVIRAADLVSFALVKYATVVLIWFSFHLALLFFVRRSDASLRSLKLLSAIVLHLNKLLNLP